MGLNLKHKEKKMPGLTLIRGETLREKLSVGRWDDDVLLDGFIVKEHCNLDELHVPEIDLTATDEDGVIFEGNLSLRNCYVQGRDREGLSLYGVVIQGDLLLDETFINGDLILPAQCDGRISLRGTVVNGVIECDDPAMALQCFMQFGKRVVCNHHAFRELFHPKNEG